MKNGTLIWIEFMLPNNTWPSENQNDGDKSTPMPESAGETVGLFNLGNTCYMNSALQCLVNIKPMHEYFCRDRLYLKQLNLTSALGHNGDLVVAFANIMQQMWNSNQVLVPRGFKATLGKLREQFEGDE